MKNKKQQIWNQLKQQAESAKESDIFDLFNDPNRADKYCLKFEDFLFDFSKQIFLMMFYPIYFNWLSLLY